MPHQGRQLKEAVDKYKPNDPAKPSKVTGFAERMGISKQWAYSYFEKERLDPEIRKRAAAALDIPETDLFTFYQPDTSLSVVGEDLSVKGGNLLEPLGDGLFQLHALLVDQKSLNRYLTSWGDHEYLGGLKSYSIIVDSQVQGVFRGFQVAASDVSMQNPGSSYSLEPGDIVTGRLLNRSQWREHLNFESHPFWVIVHKDLGILERQITSHDRVAAKIGCCSLSMDDAQFPNLDIALDDVIQLFTIIKVQKDFP